MSIDMVMEFVVEHFAVLYWTGVVAVIVYMGISIYVHNMLCGQAVVMTLILAFTLSWIGILICILNDILNWLSEVINEWLL